MNSIFEEKTKDSLRSFISKWAALADINQEKAYELALRSLAYYRGGSEKTNLRSFQELERRWYASLKRGAPDYSVYDDPYFLSDIWACWILYSRKYLTSMNSKKALRGRSIVEDAGEVSSAADLGCGFGYTTAGLKELFPNANVVGTNLESTCQFRLASALGVERGFSLVPSVDRLGRRDLVFASEYFEHIENPVEHLKEVFDVCAPRFIITANSFGTTSVGHFLKYRHGDALLDGKAVSRIFNGTLRSSGYEKVDTTCWNGRPAYWRKRK